jgi:hypothetical protein
MADVADAKPEEVKSSKKKTNPLVFVGIGCLALLVLLGIGSTIFVRFFAKKVGVGLLQNAIEQKTGVKTNLQDVANGKMTFTDEKTGTKVDVGTGTIPDTFPKDFPIYPGSKVTAVLSGAQQGKSNGFWVTLTTSDSLDKVSTYYTTNLKANGWSQTASYTAGTTTTQTVSKGKLSGTVGITQNDSSKETEIVIMIGEDQTTETPTE